ncbi:MAG: carbon starvation CstA family protein [Planctomycetota bacterium]
MSLPLLALAFLALLIAGYRIWGGFVARRLGLHEGRPTPAHTRADGVDYLATPPFYLFGQHFSAIAAAGPIAGPIIACQAFGWAPCLLWIGLGVVLIGAVHDISALAASVRHEGRSIAEIAREQIGPRAGLAMLAFIWIALIYVIVAFADITAGSFVTGPEELGALAANSHAATFHPGGAVAAASVLYLGLSLLLGLVQRWLRPPLWLVSVIFVPAAFALAWVGTLWSEHFLLDKTGWALLILGYCALASLTPVWLLLQPRGYLGGFVLYGALLLGVIGIAFGGFSIQQPAFTGFDVRESAGATGLIFPFLFVTIACGACSGFHGLVCSGTTSKQIDRESHVQPVGYGAMLAEGCVAFIALVTIMIATTEETARLPAAAIYGQGLGRFLTLLIGEEHLPFAITFGAMAFSTFVFDTLDVSTRLSRLILQELTGWRGTAGAAAATLLTLALPAVLLGFAPPDMWKRFWVLFGASNQLLAALTLLVVGVWLAKQGRRAGIVVLPMIFVLLITLWALGALLVSNLHATQGLDLALVNALASGALIVLALVMLALSVPRLRRA